MSRFLERDSWQMVIDGQPAHAADGATFDALDPSTGVAWASLPAAGASDVDRAVNAAHRAFEDPAWAGLTATQRGNLLFRLADLIDEHADELGRLESRANGKLLRETSAQAKAIPRWYRFFGGMADKLEGTVPSMDLSTMIGYVVREPLGVVAALVPWNSPLMLASWKLAPALAAGNTIVIKPSEVASVSLLALGELCGEAGFPPGVVNVLTGFGDTCGMPLVSHPGVAHITFTGGPETAVSIAHAAAENLTPTTFELGGKSANIVFADADFDSAIVGVLAGIFGATGQSCIAGSRLLVDHRLHDVFVERLVLRARAIRLGDPTDPDTQMGPITTQGQFDRIAAYVDGAATAGATVATGGRAAHVSGSASNLFYEPTILTNVRPEMAVAQEEVFGPVLSVIPFDSDEDAVRIANGTPYSLAAGVWTRDVKRAHRVAKSLRAGTVWVNTYRTASPLTPFGGSGRSGHGRENGVAALEEFTQAKSVLLELGDTVPDPFIIKFAG